MNRRTISNCIALAVSLSSGFSLIAKADPLPYVDPRISEEIRKNGVARKLHDLR